MPSVLQALNNYTSFQSYKIKNKKSFQDMKKESWDPAWDLSQNANASRCFPKITVILV